METFFKFVLFKALKSSHQEGLKIGNNIVYLMKKPEENIHNSGIENCGTDFMLEDMGRGNFRFSRRWAWLFRNYIWASKVPSLKKRVARVVDIGCDVGEIRKIISRSFYTRNPEYLGIDIDHKRILKGAKKIQFRKEAIYVQHDITTGLDFIKSDSVDLVFFGETIEHFDRKYGILILKEIYRILKKNSRICISTPNKNHSKGYDFHVYEYSITELEDELQKIGFVIDRTYGWQTTEKLIRSDEGAVRYLKTYDILKRGLQKDLAVPIMAFLDPNKSDAFCVEALKK